MHTLVARCGVFHMTILCEYQLDVLIQFNSDILYLGQQTPRVKALPHKTISTLDARLWAPHVTHTSV